MTKQKQLILLSTLLLFEAGLLFQQFNTKDPTITTQTSRARISSASIDKREMPLSIRFDLLNQKPPAPAKNTKNIFRSLLPPPPPKPKAIVRPPRPKPRVIPPPPPPPPPRIIIKRPPPKPRGPSSEEIARANAKMVLDHAKKELAKFRYLGYLERNGQESAFLSRGNELYIAILSEEIEERFLLKTLSIASIQLQEKQTGAEITLRLSEE